MRLAKRNLQAALETQAVLEKDRNTAIGVSEEAVEKVLDEGTNIALMDEAIAFVEKALMLHNAVGAAARGVCDARAAAAAAAKCV